MKKIALYFLVLLVLGCKEPKADVVSNQINFKQEIVRLPTGEIFPSYQITQMLINKTYMSNVNLGYDSLYIRIWYLYDLEAQAIDIFYKNDQWDASYSVIKQEPKDTVIKRTVIKISPALGWQKFSSQLLKTDITTLKSSFQIPGYEHNADGSSAVIEVSTKLNYRIYSYGSVDLNKDKDVAKNIVEIVKLLKEEFKIEPIHGL